MMVADPDVLLDFLEDRAPVAGRSALELGCGDLRTTTVTRFGGCWPAPGRQRTDR
jgi:hypothetical protein